MLCAEAVEHILVDLVRDTLENRQQQLAFVGEIYIEGAHTDARLRRDIIGRRFFIAALLKQADCGLDDLFLGLFTSRLLGICRQTYYCGFAHSTLLGCHSSTVRCAYYSKYLRFPSKLLLET